VDLDNLCLVTDPSLLTRHDAQLYEYLSNYFTVTIVTVCYAYHRKEGVCSACVLGPVPASLPLGPVYTAPACPAPTTTTDTTDASDTTLHNIYTTATTTSSAPHITTSAATPTTTSITTSTTTGVLIVSVARGYGKYGVVYDSYRDETASVSFVAGLQVSLKVDT